MSQPIDLLIEPRWLIPIEPHGTVLEGQAVAIAGGEIAAVLPAQEAQLRFRPARRIVLPGHVLIPGLIIVGLIIIP